MKEYLEFRIPERHARLYLEPSQGELHGASVRRLIVATDDPLYKKIGDIDYQLNNERQNFFHGWNFYRKYTSSELQSAELFHLEINAVFEPAGELCGTVYDEKDACALCGAGRKQVSDLFLDIRKAPKGKDIARTIADEWIITQKLAERLIDAKLTGFALHPVHNKARYQDDPMDLSKVPSGRELIKRAEDGGFVPYSWEFSVWVNRPEQIELSKKATDEYAMFLEKRSGKGSKYLPIWYQLMITSKPLQTIPPTYFKSRPFSSEENDEKFRCPLGHVSGLNLFSEVWVSRMDWDGNDICITKDMVGVRRGVLVPTPLILISQRFRQLLITENIKGYKIEIAHLS